MDRTTLPETDPGVCTVPQHGIPEVQTPCSGPPELIYSERSGYWQPWCAEHYFTHGAGGRSA